MAKKRTSLDSLLSMPNEVQTSKADKKPNSTEETPKKIRINNQAKTPSEKKISSAETVKNEIIKQTVYLPSAVYEQLRQLAFEERKKMHDYLVEGLDRVFKDRGLKPYVELSDKKK